jgi:hypothetical protein
MLPFLTLRGSPRRMLTRLIVGCCLALPLAGLSGVRGDVVERYEIASSGLPRWVPRPIGSAAPNPRPRRLPPVNFVGNGTASKSSPVTLPSVPDEPFELPSLTVPGIPETPTSTTSVATPPRSTTPDAVTTGGKWAYAPDDRASPTRRPIRFPTLVTTQDRTVPLSEAEPVGPRVLSPLGPGGPAVAGAKSSTDRASTASAVTDEPQSPSDQFGSPAMSTPMPPESSPPPAYPSQRSQGVQSLAVPQSARPLQDGVVDPMTPLPEDLPRYRPIPPGKAVRLPVVMREGKGNAAVCDDTPMLRNWSGGYLRNPLSRLPSRLPAP